MRETALTDSLSVFSPHLEVVGPSQIFFSQNLKFAKILNPGKVKLSKTLENPKFKKLSFAQKVHVPLPSAALAANVRRTLFASARRYAREALVFIVLLEAQLLLFVNS